MTSASLSDASQNLLDTQKSNAAWKKDRKNIFLIFVLYIIQALPQGILFISIPVTLTSKGAKYNDLILITMSYIPFCFKSFVSPILNRYYFKNFGRGKTYIVSSQYIIGLILLFLAYQGDKIFELESIPWLSAVSIITIIALMPADISLDGWMVNLISAENSSYGAVCQSIGFNLGFFLSFNLFLPLSSVEFCNSYIYSTPQETAVIPVGPYIAIMAIAIILFTAWIQFFFKEEEPANQSSGSLEEVIKTLKVFFLNKHFRKLFFIYCTWNLIFGPIHNLYPGLIMEKGVSKELFTNLNTPITPMLFVITIWLGALCKKHPETRVANTFWISRLLATFFIYATIVYLHIIPEEFKVPALFTASFLSSISFNGIAVALGAFASRVAKETYGGPVMSTFGAIGCFSRLVSDVFMFTLLNWLGWDNLALLTLGGMFIYAVVFIKGMNSFEGQNLKSLIEPKVKTE